MRNTVGIRAVGELVSFAAGFWDVTQRSPNIGECVHSELS